MFFFFFFFQATATLSRKKCPEKGVGVAGGGRNDFVVQSNLIYRYMVK